MLNFINILIFSLLVLEFDFNLTNQSYLILKIFSFILLLNYSSYIIFSHNDYIKHKKINKFLFFFLFFFRLNMYERDCVSNFDQCFQTESRYTR